MRYVPDWRNRPPLPPSFTERHPWVIPALLLLACLFNVGCSPGENVANGMSRWVDSTNGVTCYTYYQRAISCLPPVEEPR